MAYEFTLLLTACISPQKPNNDKFPLIRIDPLVRLKDYILALNYWLQLNDNRITRIVFVENSGYDLSSLKQLCNNNPYNRKIEFIQYSSGYIPNGLHYGYDEISMIDKCFNDSKLIKESLYIIKVTGRLYFPKIGFLLNHIKSDIDILIDSRNYHFYTDQQYCLTTLFIVKREFYMHYLYDAKHMMSVDLPLIEHLFYKILMPLYIDKKNKLILRFPINLYPKGIGAHTNDNYSSLKNITKNSIRHFARILLPKLWI